jgi:hypothetical protein
MRYLFESYEDFLNEGTTPQFKALIKKAKQLRISSVDELMDLIDDEFNDEGNPITGADFEIAKKTLKLKESFSGEDFLSEMALSSEEKKARRKERRAAKKQGIKLPKISSKSSGDSKKMTSADLSVIDSSLPSERWQGRDWFISYFTSERDGKFYVGISAGGKRGYPRDADIKALNTSKPALPSGYVYATGVAVNMYSGKPITVKTIKDADEYYDDRGYTEYEFDGEVYYEVIKK